MTTRTPEDREREHVLRLLAAYREARTGMPDAVRRAVELGISQTEVAREAGLSREGVRKILARPSSPSVAAG